MSASAIEGRERVQARILTGIVSRLVTDGGASYVFLDDANRNPDGSYQSDQAIIFLQDEDILTIHDPKDPDKFHHVWQEEIELEEKPPRPGMPLIQRGVARKQWDKWFRRGFPATLLTPGGGAKGATGYCDIEIQHGQAVSVSLPAGK